MKKIIPVLFSYLFLAACHNSSPKVQQISDHDLTLQVMRLDDSAAQAGSYTYKARLVLNKTLLGEQSTEAREALVYRMDSCFYIQQGINKVYASLVQPIAGGVPGTFEYLLEFNQIQDNGQHIFVYDDRYLNHKKYNINLN